MTLAAALPLAVLAFPGCSPDEGGGGKMGGAMDKGKMDGGSIGKGVMDKGKMDGAMPSGKMEGAMDKGKMDGDPK
jgi:hypothetical protein